MIDYRGPVFGFVSLGSGQLIVVAMFPLSKGMVRQSGIHREEMPQWAMTVYEFLERKVELEVSRAEALHHGFTEFASLRNCPWCNKNEDLAPPCSICNNSWHTSCAGNMRELIIENIPDEATYAGSTRVNLRSRGPRASKLNSLNKGPTNRTLPGP